jgi:selenide, water dikinase
VKRIVLLGGGHSHIEVLRQLTRRPMPGADVTLISHGTDTPYSGMLPGVVAGHYRRDEAHIDLRRLTAAARGRFLVDDVVGLDLGTNTVRCRTITAVPFDLLSINVGSTPNAASPGALEHATAVKPIDRFLARWDELRARIMADDGPRRIAVVGGGAGGVELLLSVQHHLQALIADAGQRPDRVGYHLFTSGPAILPSHAPRARRLFARILERRGVQVHLATPIERVSSGRLHAAAGISFAADEILWTTEARAAAWLRASGLATDDDGFVRVDTTLRSTSHANVFAAGDVAAVEGYRLPKSGVYAVREGPVLARNLRRAVAGAPLEAYRPQPRALSLISTGDRAAIAARGAFAVHGAWVWRWKDWIDRRFMERYQA